MYEMSTVDNEKRAAFVKHIQHIERLGTVLGIMAAKRKKDIKRLQDEEEVLVATMEIIAKEQVNTERLLAKLISKYTKKK